MTVSLRSTRWFLVNEDNGRSEGTGTASGDHALLSAGTGPGPSEAPLGHPIGGPGAGQRLVGRSPGHLRSRGTRRRFGVPAVRGGTVMRGVHMRLGTAIALLALGAILTFALRAD